MLKIKTVSELRKNIPEVVERINDLKIFFDTATMMLEDMQRRYSEGETGYWASLSAYAETLKNQMSYYAEIEYLQGLLNKYCK